MVQDICVGLDVHARSVAAFGLDRVSGEVFQAGLSADNDQILGWLAGLPGPASVVYEAGPTGYGLARALTRAGFDTMVAAPSRLPVEPGSRVKTDRRDAKRLAGLLAGGLVTGVRIPDEDEEIARDLVRARDDARTDLTRAKARLSKLLLRHGLVWTATKNTWAGAHLAWLRKLRFGDPLAQAVFDNDLVVVDQASSRLARLDERIHQLIPGSRWEAVTLALGCLRGISELTGFSLAVEIGDWSRFTGSSIASFVGLVPSEHSSGGSRRQGRITKAGNKHARRLLIEAAWHHQRSYRPGASLRARWAQATPMQAERGDQANRRLHQQWVKYERRGKHSAAANTAIARELSGFCWSLAVMT